MPTYTSTVVSPLHIGVAVVFAVAAVVAASIDGQWWIGVPVALVILLIGVHVGVVQLVVGPEEVRAGQGPWGGGRRIPVAEIADTQAAELTFGQVLGVGLPTGAKPGRPAPERPTSRLTVRPGPTLLLVLHTRERIWVSTADPAAAASALRT
ncbi:MULTISPECIES: hypothetical protein [unclassified Pseudonocardia]|uniref:hypothetical protein n=1 Tax=unclassified Pseudonocardia TaxID=2619320 RepID=UPI00096049B4|nr:MULTISPECIES: hypothetical protein [unclassified Pseudonocardia]MBN9097704.1 hypothetical protein [Pseudonocardia sp.]OJY40000.1 MAG: hypothetical protein BGP03_22365 [Pseudonocardia sp. 73-21]